MIETAAAPVTYARQERIAAPTRDALSQKTKTQGLAPGAAMMMQTAPETQSVLQWTPVLVLYLCAVTRTHPMIRVFCVLNLMFAKSNAVKMYPADQMNYANKVNVFQLQRDIATNRISAQLVKNALRTPAL